MVGKFENKKTKESFIVMDSDGFIETSPPKTYKPKKYEPVFVWNKDHDINLPAKIRICWKYYKQPKNDFFDCSESITTFPEEKYITLKGISRLNEAIAILNYGEVYLYFHKFNSKLVGVPIKDFSKGENNENGF